MKISDPLGKVYTHTMFKKKSYNIPKGGEDEFLDKNKSQSDEDDDGGSDVSDQSDDSLSTKSSRIVPSSRARSSSRRRSSGRDEEEQVEQDREDAISYASRASRNDRHKERSSSRRGSRRPTKKYSAENIGPPGTSYSLWTAQRSLKRDHKRKFNRSLCGVLLGVSIVLVILGILGIIGIAVYLGVVQKIESPNKDLVSIDGAFRVVSEDFSLSLLNPLSETYQENSGKYREMIKTTYRKSYLRDSFIKVVIDGFSSGSVKVFFKVILDKKFLPGRTIEDPVTAARDVFVQEVMAIENSEFQDETIDIDSIEFSLSKVQDVSKKYLDPEPYQGEEELSSAGSIWQNLAASTASSVQGKLDAIQEPSESISSTWQGQDRDNMFDSYANDKFDRAVPGSDPIDVPKNTNGWSLPKYPTNLMYDQGQQNNLLLNQYANVVTPQTPLIISQQNGRSPQYYSPQPRMPSLNFNQNFPSVKPSPTVSTYAPKSPTYPPVNLANYPPSLQNQINKRKDSNSFSGNLMSDSMKPPPPPASNNLESLFERENPFLTNKNNLERLFMTDNKQKPNIAGWQNKRNTPPPMQTVSPTQLNYRMSSTPQPQIQNRRLDQTGNENGRYNGFWNMMHKNDGQGNKQQTNGKSISRNLNRNDPVLSLQDELEQLLLLESQQNQQNSNIYNRNQLMDEKELQQLANKLLPMMEPQNSNQNSISNSKPSLSWTALGQNKNTNSRVDPVSVTNFGTSGLKPINNNMPSNNQKSTTIGPLLAGGTSVVDIRVPQGQDVGFFGVGSSLSFSGHKPQAPRQGQQSNRQQPQLQQPTRKMAGSMMNSISSLNRDQVVQASFPIGDDPNIVYPQQIQAGTQLRQGPQGPIVSSPRPMNMQVTQTPHAPVVPNPDRNVQTNMNYNIHRAGSGQIPNYVYNQNSRQPQSNQHHMPPIQTTKRPSLSSQLMNAVTSKPKQTFQSTMSKIKKEKVANRRTDDTRTGIRRQDLIAGLLPAAIGLSSTAGVSPVGIFSNLLNAYATIDSKHDITGKLINGAASWFQGTPDEVMTADTRSTQNTEETTTTPTVLSSSTSTTTYPTQRSTKRFNNKKRTTTERSFWKTSTTTRRYKYPVTATNVQVRDKISTFTSDENEQYLSIFNKIKNAANSQESEYDIVTNYDKELPPVRSNLYSDGPLRPKPPSEQMIQVSPAPHNYNQDIAPIQYGVSNPNWYSNEVKASTAGYGPDDFVVETVNLDKNFFYQFFTSKPMIIDTDVVTSTSVQVNYDQKFKRGRETSDDVPNKKGRETLSNLPEHLVGNEILPQHILKKTGEAYDPLNPDTESSTRKVFTVTQPDNLPIILNNASKFKRYQIPPEVRITHNQQPFRNGKDIGRKPEVKGVESEEHVYELDTDK
eukprot:TRINITY_DN13582_c0_g1_i1.p1 TRINITY_DN13582_c0_g1~~TRINITY_DN13582_c0_g1_i1.p1  ORF type:complete len:1386 (+),score=289.54 TRINITY_DN13582_c0_g1_i1:332-4489(+)